MHYTCRYTTISEIAVKSGEQMKGTAALLDLTMHAFLLPSTRFLPVL